MTTIDPSLYLSNQTNQKAKSSNSVLGKDDFLKLLIAQLQNQDPMNPMKDTQYISQMANFTSLEQTQNMNSLLEKFINSQSNNTLVSQSNMIGKPITWQKSLTDDQGNTTTQSIEAVVKSISLVNGAVIYHTDAGDKVSLNQITSIGQAGSGQSQA